MQQYQHQGNMETATDSLRPGARYAYYRRCQMVRRCGEQCKAPAEKGSQICHAHAGQMATALRGERERQAVLAEAVAVMRRKRSPEYEAKDLLTDFNGIQVTIAVAAQALIDGRIACKTAGRLGWQLQMMAKLLKTYHRGHRGKQRGKTSTAKALTAKVAKEREVVKQEAKASLPQICADERSLVRVWAANEREKARIDVKILEFKPDCRWLKGPPLLVRAA